MAKPGHVETILQRERLYKYLAEHPDETLDLRGANLRGTVLSAANLRRADFSAANLSEAVLVGANLSGANLRQASLNVANLEGADLREADLSGADLRRTNLNLAILRGADMTKSILWETIFGAADLRDAKGLADCDFKGPCVLDIRAIQQSGMLPVPFLRGCGLPDSFIDYLPSLLNNAIQFFSCFISHSTKDRDFADRLYADLQARGVRCWFAPHDIQGGRKIHEQIDEAIRVYDKLLLILSDATMNSNWVKTEIANAGACEEKQERQMLFPITLVPFERIKDWKLFDADRGIDSAREIREYFIPDFSNWKDHDSYAKAFEQLLRNLSQ
jgi:uncharacterized protein YjbI with pentapeptide repeats